MASVTQALWAGATGPIPDYVVGSSVRIIAVGFWVFIAALFIWTVVGEVRQRGL